MHNRQKMKITIKTLKQEAFHIEVDVEKDTVRTLKEKFFQESKQDYPVDRQRLIYMGKMMEDDDLLSSYSLDDKKFVVVMKKKPATTPAEPAAAVLSSSTVPSATAVSVTAKSETEAATATASAAAAAASSTEKPKEEEKPKEDPKPEEPPQDDIQIKIQRIKEMGYSEEEARIALEICDNNPDRAVEYLLSEIATSSGGGGGGSGGGSGGTPGGLLGTAGSQESRLAFLREHPTFIEMKRLLQEDPNLLPHLLQRIQSSNPELMRIISENQIEFLALINEGADGPEGRPNAPRELETTAAAMVDSLTQSDMDAIDRLKALGYPEHLVIQAYIACERNEYQAAEFLVSQTLDDDE